MSYTYSSMIGKKLSFSLKMITRIQLLATIWRNRCARSRKRRDILDTLLKEQKNFGRILAEKARVGWAQQLKKSQISQSEYLHVTTVLDQMTEFSSALEGALVYEIDRWHPNLTSLRNLLNKIQPFLKCFRSIEWVQLKSIVSKSIDHTFVANHMLNLVDNLKEYSKMLPYKHPDTQNLQHLIYVLSEHHDEAFVYDEDVNLLLQEPVKALKPNNNLPPKQISEKVAKYQSVRNNLKDRKVNAMKPKGGKQQDSHKKAVTVKVETPLMHDSVTNFLHIKSLQSWRCSNSRELCLFKDRVVQVHCLKEEQQLNLCGHTYVRLIQRNKLAVHTCSKTKVFELTDRFDRDAAARNIVKTSESLVGQKRCPHSSPLNANRVSFECFNAITKGTTKNLYYQIGVGPYSVASFQRFIVYVQFWDLLKIDTLLQSTKIGNLPTLNVSIPPGTDQIKTIQLRAQAIEEYFNTAFSLSPSIDLKKAILERLGVKSSIIGHLCRSHIQPNIAESMLCADKARKVRENGEFHRCSSIDEAFTLQERLGNFPAEMLHSIPLLMGFAKNYTGRLNYQAFSAQQNQNWSVTIRVPFLDEPVVVPASPDILAGELLVILGQQLKCDLSDFIFSVEQGGFTLRYIDQDQPIQKIIDEYRIQQDGKVHRHNIVLRKWAFFPVDLELDSCSKNLTRNMLFLGDLFYRCHSGELKLTVGDLAFLSAVYLYDRDLECSKKVNAQMDMNILKDLHPKQSSLYEDAAFKKMVTERHNTLVKTIHKNNFRSLRPRERLYEAVHQDAIKLFSEEPTHRFGLKDAESNTSINLFVNRCQLSFSLEKDKSFSIPIKDLSFSTVDSTVFFELRGKTMKFECSRACDLESILNVYSCFAKLSL